MSKFLEFWKKVKEEKSVVHETFSPEGKETDAYQDPDILDVENKLLEDNKLSEKGQKVEKPGTSIHTAKWDKCVADLKDKGNVDSPYAVCTAQLGEESFKSEFRGLAYTKSLINKAKKAMGTGFAGPVPVSLLADQDLEGEAEETDEALRYGVGLEANKSNTATNDKLVELKDKAEDAENDEQKDNIVDRIKETQMKRQKATLKDRGVIKTFKEAWKTLNQESEYDIALPGEPRETKPVQIDQDAEDPESTIR